MTSWVEVSVGALRHNAAVVAALVAPAALTAVVKANGYGHGAVIAARAALEGGATQVAVTTVTEAAELRAAGLSAPILLLASHARDEAADVAALDLTASVSDLAAAAALSAAAEAAGRPVAVHLLVDVGMGREGVLPAELPALAAQVRGLPGLRLEGVGCHFPNSIAADKRPTEAQLQRFLAAVAALPQRPRWVHAANSGAAVDLPAARLDLVRVGTLLYGQYPSEHVTRRLDLQPTWRLRARCVEIRDLPAGATVGYGSECRLTRATRVGTLLVGWQQGFALQPESLSRGWRGALRALRWSPPVVTVRGVRCPVIGRIAMQSCTVDLTAVPDVTLDDVVDLPARRVTLDRGVPRLPVA